MENPHSNSIHDDEETLATPRFVAPAADAPKRVVPLERIRARAASTVRRVRYGTHSASERRSHLSWLPIVALVMLAGVAGGFLLATSGDSETVEDAPVVRSELEAAPDGSNAEAKKAAFVEKGNPAAESADLKTDAADSAVAESVSAPEPQTGGDNLLTVEQEPKVSTEIELRNDENPSAKQSAPRGSQDERLELIRKDAERQAAREREEKNRLKRQQKTEENAAEKPKTDDAQNKKDEKPAENDSEESAKTDQF